jgi:DNA-binding transcriptional LysR family regulator
MTSVGQTLAATGSRLITELDATLKELRDIGEQHRGRVVMACVPSVSRGLMPKCVEYCAEKWPEVSFAIEDIAAKDVVAKVQRGDIEFGLSGGEIEASELHIESLMRDPFLLVCRRDDALAERKPFPGQNCQQDALSCRTTRREVGSRSSLRWRAPAFGRRSFSNSRNRAPCSRWWRPSSASP